MKPLATLKMALALVLVGNALLLEQSLFEFERFKVTAGYVSFKPARFFDSPTTWLEAEVMVAGLILLFLRGLYSYKQKPRPA